MQYSIKSSSTALRESALLCFSCSEAFHSPTVEQHSLIERDTTPHCSYVMCYGKLLAAHPQEKCVCPVNVNVHEEIKKKRLTDLPLSAGRYHR